MIFAGCGCGEAPPELPDIEYKLVITDSIGVETGDSNYMLGKVLSPVHSPDGNIVYLDWLKKALFIYTPDGEFIRSVGREGSGPGEFQRPMTISYYSNGNILVWDVHSTILFDSDYNYLNQTSWSGVGPLLVSAVDSGGFIGLDYSLREGENGTLAIQTLGLWDGNIDPSVEYFRTEHDFVFNPETIFDFSTRRNEGLWSCATRDGRVFYCWISIDELVIHGSEPDGTPFLLIEDDNVHRVRKTEDEIQTERDNFLGGRSIPDDYPITIKPDPYKYTVRGMFLDGEDRLWVRMGCYPGIVFRVYDMNGEILFHAMVEYDGDPIDLNTWEITGDEYGFLGHNTSYEEYQRIYMLELTKAE